jgi:AcrR family transcriptional regulator
VANDERLPLKRRVPQQARSRERFERILEVSGDLVVAGGVESVNTRAIATAAGIPVASLYQYFADKDDVLLALVERDVEEMDAQVWADLAEVDVFTVRTLVETTLRAYAKAYARRPTLVVIWLRGRTNPAISEYCRAHNRENARRLFELARDLGMVPEDATGVHAELATEVADRMFQLAFETSLEGDPHVMDEAIEVVTAYLETHATSSGITGVKRAEPTDGDDPDAAQSR